MILEQIDEKRLLIALSRDDMHILDLTFKQLSWKNEYSRQIIKKILLRAENEIGFSVGNNQMMIEAIPQNSGCVVLVTVLPQKTPNRNRKLFKIKETIKPYLFKFCSLENLFCAIERIFKNKSIALKSSIFECNNVYFLLVYSKGSLPFSIRSTLTEYCDVLSSDDISISELIERGKLIVKNQAIETIGKTLLKS
ncbi:MAG: adaptor protein MecA [Clostridia bacterium]|nr:adaptor protein MecA [Clostridia bacterium]